MDQRNSAYKLVSYTSKSGFVGYIVAGADHIVDETAKLVFKE